MAEKIDHVETLSDIVSRLDSHIVKLLESTTVKRAPSKPKAAPKWSLVPEEKRALVLQLNASLGKVSTIAAQTGLTPYIIAKIIEHNSIHDSQNGSGTDRKGEVDF